MGRLFALLSVLLASFALGKAADDWRLASAIAAIGTVLSAIGPRWEVDRGRRLLTAGMGGGAGYIVAKVLYEPHAGALDDAWTRFAAACILAASARFLLMGSGARSVTTGLVFIALLAVGETHVAGYGIFVALFVRQIGSKRRKHPSGILGQRRLTQGLVRSFRAEQLDT